MTAFYHNVHPKNTFRVLHVDLQGREHVTGCEGNHGNFRRMKKRLLSVGHFISSASLVEKDTD